MTKRYSILYGFLFILFTGISAQGIVLDEGKSNDGNMGFIVKKFTENPVKDNLVQSNFVFELIKNAGENSKSWHGIEVNQRIRLTPSKHILELYLLFPINENSIHSTTISLWMGNNKSGEIKKVITAMGKWQKITFDYSVLSEFKRCFNAGKDTIFSKSIFIPRREEDFQNTIVIYIDKLMFTI